MRRSDIALHATGWDDPNLLENAKAFFLQLNRCNFESAVKTMAEKAQQVEEKEQKPLDPNHSFWLGLENLPVKYIDQETFRCVMRLRHNIETELPRLQCDTDDPYVASTRVTLTAILGYTRELANRLILFLTFDSMFHPNYRFRTNTIDILIVPDSELESYRNCTHDLLIAAALYNMLHPSEDYSVQIAPAVSALQTAGNAYFSSMQAIFPVMSVNKCQRAFNTLMTHFGFPTAADHVDDYIRRYKTMANEVRAEYRKIKEEKKITTAEIATSDAATASTSNLLSKLNKTVENMDRRQRNLVAWVKTSIAGFIKLFSPRPAIRAKVAAAFTVDGGEDALRNYSEPRKSIIRQVIKLTQERPITRDGKGRGNFTLANAARVVWDKHHREWEKLGGAFENYNQLKSSCYNLQKNPQTDPFHYQN